MDNYKEVLEKLIKLYKTRALLARRLRMHSRYIREMLQSDEYKPGLYTL